MKRDMDLCRKILQFIEDKVSHVEVLYTVDIDALGPGSEISQNTVNYHVRLLVDAGLIDSKGVVRGGTPLVRGLTWAGHEFVEKTRDQGLWEKAKQIAKEKSGGLALEILSPLLTDLIKQAVKLI